MGIVYEESEQRGGGGFVPYDRINATAGYLKHFYNWCYLEFITKNGTKFMEKQQAQKELEIAERKMTFMKKHPNWDLERASVGARKICRDWNREYTLK